MFQVYAIFDTNKNEPVYIGRTNGSLKQRMSGHKSASKKPKGRSLFHKWLAEYLPVYGEPEIKALKTCTTLEEAIWWEQEYVTHFRRNSVDLLNTLPRAAGVFRGLITEKEKEDARRHAEEIDKRLKDSFAELFRRRNK